MATSSHYWSSLDVTLLGAFCQMAQSQGTDLWTPYNALEMAEYVAKYNPVLVVASAGNYTFTGSSIWQKATTTTAGALTGVFSKTIVPAGSYILTKKDNVVAFRKVDGTTNLSNCKCYIFC